MNPLLELSGSRLAQMIRQQEVSSLEVVEAHIAQIERVNPIINAVVQPRFIQAREEAKLADQLLQKSTRKRLPPFHGVPCTIKEFYHVKGMRCTGGLQSRKNEVSTDDATVVTRIKQAGIIPIGMTNASELGMWMESYNTVYGRTNNPYNPKRIPGGSSGGEGAIISAGGSPLGMGSDIGGSIRMPAFFNGICGHKPTGGLIPNTGHFPFPENEALLYMTCGPLSRRAEDLMPLLRILAGPDGNHAHQRKFQLGHPERVDLNNITILDIPGNGLIKVSQDLQKAQQKCAEALAALGANIKRMQIKDLKKSFDIWSSMLAAAEGTSFQTRLGDGTPIHLGFQLIKWVFRQSPHTLPALILALVEKFPHLTKARTRRFVAYGQELRQHLINLMGPNGVIFFPSYSRPAPKHYYPMLHPIDWIYTGIFNVMEFPVTQIPLGLNHHRLPLGIQIAGVPGNDHLTIAVALELEKIFGGWIPPWTVNCHLIP